MERKYKGPLEMPSAKVGNHKVSDGPDKHGATSRSIFEAIGRLTPVRGVLVLLIVLGSLSCSGCGRSGKTERMTIGIPPFAQNTLIFVAAHQKLFARNGLNITIKNYNTGGSAVDAMVKGEVDVAEASEFSFVRAILQKKRIDIIACNDKFENFYIVGRKDHGIEKVQDLRGKKIGVALRTIAEFNLCRFLVLNGIGIKDVHLVDIRPSQFVNAIAGGEVDAIAARQPYVHQIVEKEAGKVVVWPAQNSQATYGVLVCDGAWLKEHSDTVRRFLKSLSEAENYLIHHQDKAKKIVKKWLNYDDAHIAGIWPDHYFALSLDQTLVIAMKDEAQWIINNHLTSEKKIPDLVDHVYTDGLKAIKPEAVNIIR